jgi:hypothetical protein
MMGVVLTRMSFVPGALIVGDSRALAPITFPLRDHELCILSHFERTGGASTALWSFDALHNV